MLTLAHELGHSLGAVHDDEVEDCGHHYLMISTSNITQQMKNEFSNCSLVNMTKTLDDVTSHPLMKDCLKEDDLEPVEVSVCGNGVVEPGEECDCGDDEVLCDDPCCYPAHIRSVSVVLKLMKKKIIIIY